jgi:hypothetical protein
MFHCTHALSLWDRSTWRSAGFKEILTVFGYYVVMSLDLHSLCPLGV